MDAPPAGIVAANDAGCMRARMGPARLRDCWPGPSACQACAKACFCERARLTCSCDAWNCSMSGAGAPEPLRALALRRWPERRAKRRAPCCAALSCGLELMADGWY